MWQCFFFSFTHYPKWKTLQLPLPPLIDMVSFFPYKLFVINDGIKYLRYFLKPTPYLMVDWNSLIKMVEKMINVWSYRWISTRARLVLESTVLQSIHVYWFSLVIALALVVYHIIRWVIHFLWANSLDRSNIHLVSWDNINLTKPLVVWGLKNMIWFTKSLCAKSTWCVMFSNGL